MALTKINANVIANNTIAVGNIADNSVDATKIASNSILTRHIDDNQIGIDQLNVSDGSNGQMLTTNGSGTLAFSTPSSFDADAAQVFNESGASVDFRVESNSNANMLFVDGSADKIGIGTASPANNLHVHTDAGDEGILIKSTGDTSNAIVSDANRSSAGAAILATQGKWNGTTVADMLFLTGSDTTNKDDGIITFRTSAADDIAERMRLQSSGPVLTITEAGTDGYEALLKLDRSNASASEVGLEFHQNGSGGASVGATIYVSKIEDWTSGTSRSSRMNFQVKTDGSDQNVFECGSLGDGLKGARAPHGLRFGTDTAVANSLDDYEEGTWTPALYTYGGVTTTSSSMYGIYTKIGNICHIHCKISATLSSLPGQTWTITGLPFSGTNTNDANQRAIFAIGGDCLNTGGNTSKAHFRIAANELHGVYFNASNNTAYWGYNHMDSSTFELNVHGFYTTT